MMWTTSASRRLDDHLRECGQRHNEMLDRIKDLSEQTRGEFRAVRNETDARHAENKKRAWSVALMILGALATSYLAQHGLSAPGLHP